MAVDASDEASLDAAVKEHDLVISLIPYTQHANVIKSAIKFKKHVVTTSYVSDAMKALEKEAVEAGITVLNEIGLDPGIDHLYAVDMIDRVHKEGGKVRDHFSLLRFDTWNSCHIFSIGHWFHLLLWRPPRSWLCR